MAGKDMEIFHHLTLDAYTLHTVYNVTINSEDIIEPLASMSYFNNLIAIQPHCFFPHTSGSVAL